MRVKICGIKSVEDGLKAAEYGADAIGLLVGQEHNSTDFISPELAKDIVEKMPPFISTVLVTHFTDSDEIIKLIRKTKVNTVQLHSDIDIANIRKIKRQCSNVKIIKLVHVIDENSIGEVLKFASESDAILLDTINTKTDQVGGTGLTHDWNISKKIVESTNCKVIIAGGLNKDNISDAITKIRPFGVDVNSGVKNVDGFKDYNKLQAFIFNAKNTLN